MKTLLPSQATKRGMRTITMPAPAESEFIRNVMLDMQRIPSTVWAVVDAGLGLVEIWRVPTAPIV